MGSNPSHYTQTDSIRNQSGNSDNRPMASSRRPMPSSQQPGSIKRAHQQPDRDRRAEPVQARQSNSDTLAWPLPPNDQGSPFEMKNRDPNRYALTPLSPRVSCPLHRSSLTDFMQ